MKRLTVLLVAVLLVFGVAATHAETAPAISFDAEEYPLAAGRSISLKPVIEPKENLKLEWSSSDETVATVSAKGAVKGIAPGEAIITVKADKYEGLSATCKAIVSRAIKSIKVSPKKLSMAVGTTWTIEPEIQPEDATNKELEWTSSKESVATVDENGRITGKAVGTAKITAKAKDGGNARIDISVKVDKFDLVFNSPYPQTAHWYFRSGHFVATAKVKTGCVSIPDLRTEISAMVVGGPASEDIQVTPVKPGEDTITVKAGRTKTIIRVFVSPDAFKDEDEKKKENDQADKSNDKKRDISREKLNEDDFSEKNEAVFEIRDDKTLILGNYEEPSEENNQQNILRIGCFVDGESIWGYTEKTADSGAKIRLQAFMGGTAEKPQVIIYNPEYGMSALDPEDGSQIWTLEGKKGLFGDSILCTSDTDKGILYIAATKGSKLTALSENGEVLWNTGAKASRADKPKDIFLNEDDIEIVYENGKTARYDYNGK